MCRKAVTWDRFFYFPSRGRHAEDFYVRKIQRLRPGLNPRTWVTEASMLTTRPPKPSLKGLRNFRETHFGMHEIKNEWVNERMCIHKQHYVLEALSCLYRLHTHFSVQSYWRWNICHGITNRPKYKQYWYWSTIAYYSLLMSYIYHVPLS